MSERIDAIFENGVFRPMTPVSIANGKRVSISVEPEQGEADDLGDVEDLLDADFMDSCRGRAGSAASLEESQKILSAFRGSLAERISQERDER